MDHWLLRVVTARNIVRRSTRQRLLLQRLLEWVPWFLLLQAVLRVSFLLRVRCWDLFLISRLSLEEPSPSFHLSFPVHTLVKQVLYLSLSHLWLAIETTILIRLWVRHPLRVQVHRKCILRLVTAALGPVASPWLWLVRKRILISCRRLRIIIWRIWCPLIVCESLALSYILLEPLNPGPRELVWLPSRVRVLLLALACILSLKLVFQNIRRSLGRWLLIGSHHRQIISSSIEWRPELLHVPVVENHRLTLGLKRGLQNLIVPCVLL